MFYIFKFTKVSVGVTAVYGHTKFHVDCSSKLLSFDVLPKAKGNFMKLTMLLFQIIANCGSVNSLSSPSIHCCMSVTFRITNSVALVTLPVHNLACPLFCCSQWRRALRRRSVAACLLGLEFRILPAACLSVVTVVCCQVEVSATG